MHLFATVSVLQQACSRVAGKITARTRQQAKVQEVRRAMEVNAEWLVELESLFERRGHAWVLACLVNSDVPSEQGLRFTELARTIAAWSGAFVPDNTITRSLRRLVDEKLVEVVDDRGNPRRPLYRLTSLGQAKAETLAFILKALEGRYKYEATTGQGPSLAHIDHGKESTTVDTTVWHSARLYDHLLGGKDNFQVDRDMVAIIERSIPTIRQMAQTNRQFMRRITHFLVRDVGIRQFLDIGTGIPTSPNLHEVAQEAAPETRVIYVDNDPLVLAHARALMLTGERGLTEFLHADLLQPGRLMLNVGRLQVFDFERPVALTMFAVLMLLSDEQDPWGKAQTVMEALPAGSYVAITHPSQDFNPEAMAAAEAAGARTGAIFRPRTKADVARFFDDWELIEPGLVPILAWRPENDPDDPTSVYYWAGVARKV
jgi:DNA-binding HxlR family transcriptional regulator